MYFLAQKAVLSNSLYNHALTISSSQKCLKENGKGSFFRMI